MDREIRFQPLTDGLGFHPFEDGLPYAPASKNAAATAQNPTARPSSGTGANAAGRPQFAFPPSSSSPSPSLTTSVPLPKTLPASPADVTAERIRKELEAIQNQRIEQARATAATARAPLDIRYGIGYSIERAFAFLLDSAFNLSICASILSTALISTDIDRLETLTSGASVAVGIFLFLCNWALISAQEVAFGTTIGKRIFGLRLDGTGLECFTRSVFFIFSLLFAGLGIWMAIFDSKKRCWHDRMTKLQPK